jgi:hypothetical protein
MTGTAVAEMVKDERDMESSQQQQTLEEAFCPKISSFVAADVVMCSLFSCSPPGTGPP